MDRSQYTDVEWQLFEQHDFSSRETTLTHAQSDALVDSGYYRKSSGFPYHVLQYRRSNDDGSCLHLVWRKGMPRLHRDVFDPHASPLSMYMHMSHEARFETAATCAMAWSLVKFLAR